MSTPVRRSSRQKKVIKCDPITMDRCVVAKEAGSFGGVENLQRYSAKPRKVVSQWLMGQDAYTLHKRLEKHFDEGGHTRRE